MKAAIALFLAALCAGAAARDPEPPGTPQETAAIAARVLERQRAIDDRNTVQFAQNHARCVSALRIAELCGKDAGTFYCDARGFQPVPEGEQVKRAAPDNEARFLMQACAQQAGRDAP